MTKPPPPPKVLYNRSLSGVYGEFGSGAGSRAFYLQSAIPPRDLDLISLVSDIPGSEKWPVRALFQRDIDKERVTDGLIPYLQDTHQVRFFNPLTLTLLPMHADGNTVLPTMPTLKRETVRIDGRDWVKLERQNFYSLRWIKDQPQYAVLEWNDRRSELVAIDGQHRLFGLMSLWRDKTEIPPGEDLLTWRIPVVIVSFHGANDGENASTVLDTVRGIFVSINTQAQPVNEARRILLSDDSINALCTQELIETAHANDTLPLDARDEARVPLILFDWRGEERGKEQVRSPAALKTIVEIRNWFVYYFLGDDFSRDQKIAMGITPQNQVLHTAFRTGRLTHSQAREVRAWMDREFLPALTHLLEHFTPYRDYIAALRSAERELLDAAVPHLRRHAFDHLRFGSNHGHASIQPQVHEELERVKSQIEQTKKQCLNRLLLEDIGMRGIACAFGYLRTRFTRLPKWTDYAERFTLALNDVFSDGWISLEDATEYRRFLIHIAHDHSDTVVNYRLESASNALGSHVELLVAAYGMPWPSEWKFYWDAFLEAQIDTLHRTVARGYRKQFRPEMKEQYPDGGQALTRAVNEKAEEHARQQMDRLHKAVRTVVAKRAAHRKAQ